jgi:hypothetical protein
LVDHTAKQREQDEQRMAEATGRMEQARDLLAALDRGLARLLRRGDLARAREQYEQAEEACQVARQQADRERQARQAQQQHHQAHQKANPDLLAQYWVIVHEDRWRIRAEARAVELQRPGWSRELGERPTTVKGGHAWDRVVEQTIEYRQR